MNLLSLYSLAFICEQCNGTITLYIQANGNTIESLKATAFELGCCNPSGCTWRKRKYGREAFRISPVPFLLQVG